MAERIVTIKIKVDDKDVDKTIASIKRLEKASGNLGGKQAGAELKQLAAGATEAGSGLTGLTAAAGPVGAALAAAAAALTIAADAAVKVGMEVTRIAKEFADYTKEVDNASQRTGIGVEAMSALKVQIERTGGSFTDVQQIIKEFTKKIVDAADGSKKAAADLTSLGIKPKEAIANLDESFRQALKTIHDLPPGVEKSRAAIKLFGDEGFKLIPFIESFNGNLDEAIEHAKKFGLTLSNDDVLAAREFTKASKDIQDQVQGVTNTLGRELLPVVNDVFSDFNAWLGRNGAEVRAWAQTVAGSLQFVVNVLRQTLSQMKAALDLGGVLVQLAGGNTTGIAGFMARNSDAVNGFGGIWSSARARMGGSVGIPGGFGPADNPPGRGGRGGRGSGGGGGAAKLTPIQEMEKRLREGQAAFDLLSGSAYAQQLTVETAKIN
ncbi:MAG: hypothetical protein IT173_12485, partial [Acidobacteria bacterium]|nr:hypothetical protein [Acidobacteriota bacterium]